MITLFRARYESIQNLQTSQDYIFQILPYFATKLYHFAKFRMLFRVVLINIPNSKDCLNKGMAYCSTIVLSYINVLILVCEIQSAQ